MKKDAHGNWEREYHRYFEEGTPAGASFLCWVGGAYDSGQFEAFLEDHFRVPSDLWLGGHTHSESPDDTKGGRSCVERGLPGGTTFMNVCALTRHMVHERTQAAQLAFDLHGRIQIGSGTMLTCTPREFQPQGWYERSRADDRIDPTLRIPGRRSALFTLLQRLDLRAAAEPRPRTDRPRKGHLSAPAIVPRRPHSATRSRHRVQDARNRREHLLA